MTDSLPPPQPAALEAVERLFRELGREPAPGRAEVRERLSACLGTLDSPGARPAFEALLAGRILGPGFCPARSALLLAADEAFGWEGDPGLPARLGGIGTDLERAVRAGLVRHARSAPEQEPRPAAPPAPEAAPRLPRLALATAFQIHTAKELFLLAIAAGSPGKPAFWTVAAQRGLGIVVFIGTGTWAGRWAALRYAGARKRSLVGLGLAAGAAALVGGEALCAALRPILGTALERPGFLASALATFACAAIHLQRFEARLLAALEGRG